MSDATSEKVVEPEEKIIEAKEAPTALLLSDQFMFSIPVYQRPFTWTMDNFDDFFEDISNAMQTQAEQYFIGSILLQQTRKNSYDIVDGQQRITAIVLLLATIRDMTSNPKLKSRIMTYIYQEEDEFKEIPEVMRISPWEELNELFKEYVYKDNGTTQFLTDFGTKVKVKDQEDPRFHIFEAIMTFKNKLNNFTDMEGLVKYLLNKVYVVYIKTNSKTSAFRLFNVLNARGLPLEPSDLLKSENLGEIKDKIIRENYAKIWRGVEEELGREELSNIITFIRTIKTREKAQLSIYDEFQGIFKKSLLIRGTSFIDYFKEISDIYGDKILDPSLDNVELKEKNEYKVTIDLMKRFVPFSDWIPPTLAFYYKFKSDRDLLDFLLKLEKKVVLEWGMGSSSTERMTSLNKVIKLIDDNNDPKKIISEIELPTINEARSIFSPKLNNPQLYSVYGGRFVKYLLLKIDKDNWEIENFPGYPGTVTVEHILPQTPPQSSQWMTLFNEDERDVWTNSLGNLVLLSGRKNSQAQNYDFDKKKQIYFGQKGTAFRITQELQNIPTWNVEFLTLRQKKFVGVAEKLYLNY